ncbi:MAG TPA: hypothetical protein VGS19_11270, partial [Streptosporangiaceae bacterium]|nr:hypothetical protein [Streptosporangiaceae bacterium]
PGGRKGFDNLPATRGLFVSYGNTPHSDQIDTTTVRLTISPFINRLLEGRRAGLADVGRSEVSGYTTWP